MNRLSRIGRRGRWAVLGLLVIAACTPQALLNNITSLGGTVAGRRGFVEISFVNNTPFRAIFTFATYDPQNLDQDGIVAFQPEGDQFTASANPTERLEGNSESPVLTFSCGRAISLGGPQMLRVLSELGFTDDLDQDALEPGIGFSDRPLDDPEAARATAGRADHVLTLQGLHYPCDAEVRYTFSLDVARPECLGDTPLPSHCFLIDFEVVIDDE